MADTRTTSSLRQAIERCGYYPDLVTDALETALGTEPLDSYVVHHEATFDHDELRRHVTVLGLTPTRLIVGHTDEHPADDTSPTSYATTSTESVPLGKIASVVVSRTVADPARYVPGDALREVVISVAWGVISRLDLEPASCGDEQCEADHGYAGTASADDLSVRVSRDADGPDVVAQALSFAAALSAATARASR